MRRVSALFILLLAGCQSSTQPFDLSASADPLARASGGLRWSYMGNARYDAAFAVHRREFVAREFSYITTTAAFNVGRSPIRVGGVLVNGVGLSWMSSDGVSKANTYQGNAPAGVSDSVRLDVSGFDGDAFYSNAHIAGDFNFAPIPDTLDVSNGWTLTYANALPNDSIDVQLIGVSSKTNWSYHTRLPDTGVITIPRDSLPIDEGTTGIGLEVSRFSMDSLTTTRGHRLAIASWQTFGPIAWPIRR